MRVAVIDCGTNTERLLIADGEPGGRLTEVRRDLRFVRLGEGVDAAGRFHADALARTFAALDDYARIIRAAGAERVRFVATSAARDAANRAEFFAGVLARLGVPAEVISGQEEASLSFWGALAGGAGDDAGDSLVTDIGGGSTELIRGTPDGGISAAVSLDMGSVRLKERFWRHDPPSAAEIGQARAFVADLLDGAEFPFEGTGTWIGVAGTNTSLSAMNLGLAAYDRATVHNSCITFADLSRLTEHLLALSVSETIAGYPSLPAERAPLIAAGALIATAIGERVGAAMHVRETDILDGAALRLVNS